MGNTDKLYIKTRDPIDRNKWVSGELQNIVSKKECPNEYTLEDGTVVKVFFDMDSISLPIDPETKQYFLDLNGERKYNIDYHLRVIVAKSKRDD